MTTYIHPDAAAPGLAPISDRTRLALATVGSALALGLAGNLFAREMEPGAGWAVTLSLVIVAIGLLARVRSGLTVEQRLMFIPIVFLAESFAWRDAGGLFAFNLLALLLSLAVLQMSLAADGAWSLARAGFAGIIHACVRAAAFVPAGAPMLVLHDVELRGAAGGDRSRRVGAVARGALLALPLVLVFGALLMSADPLFSRLITDTFALDLGEAMPHLIATGFLAWVAGGYLRGALLARPPAALPTTTTRLGLVEVGMVLGALDLLFVAFLLLQARYLFGGAEHVITTAGLSYATYARGGFYELLFVAILALPVLLGAHLALATHDQASARYRRLAGVLAICVGVMLVSAMARMQLYIATYGLTEDRIYASAIMLWLGVVFAAYFVTVQRGRPERLGGVALVSAWVTLAGVNAMNPPAVIARVNLSRALAGREFDGQYLGNLGAGAVPHTLHGIASITDRRERCLMASRLLANWIDRPDDGWREWNKARAEARSLVAARRAELERWSPTHQVVDCGPDVAPAARVAGAPAAPEPWWAAASASGTSRDRRLLIDSPAAPTTVVRAAEVDRSDALSLADRWIAATSFAAGGGADWAHLEAISLPTATLVPPRAELPVAGEAPHGMWRTPLQREVRIAGDLAQVTVPYELRHEQGGPLVARGLLVLDLRRVADASWRISRAAWDNEPGVPRDQ